MNRQSFKKCPLEKQERIVQLREDIVEALHIQSKALFEDDIQTAMNQCEVIIESADMLSGEIQTINKRRESL